MGATIPPRYIVIAWAAWVGTFIYFRISGFFTWRTVQKETGRNRVARSPAGRARCWAATGAALWR